MNNKPNPDNPMTPEEQQMLEASRRLQAFTDQVMKECFPSIFEGNKTDSLTQEQFDALPNKEDTK